MALPPPQASAYFRKALLGESGTDYFSGFGELPLTIFSGNLSNSILPLLSIGIVCSLATVDNLAASELAIPPVPSKLRTFYPTCNSIGSLQQ
jgi:hypothetical protein